MKKTIFGLLFALIALPVFSQEITERHNFSMNLGYSFKPGDDHPVQFFNMIDNSDHASAMKHGYELEFDYDYRFHKFFAFGFKASMFGSVHGFDVDAIGTDGKPTTQYRTDDMNIFYVGPTFKAQLPTIAEHYDLWARATVGYLNMRNTDKAEQTNTYRGDSFGYGLGIGADYIVNKYISVGLAASFLSGSVSTLHLGEEKIDISDYEESLFRFNINFGIRIKL